MSEPTPPRPRRSLAGPVAPGSPPAVSPAPLAGALTAPPPSAPVLPAFGYGGRLRGERPELQLRPERELTGAEVGPHAVFPDAAVVEARLRRRVWLAALAVWTPLVLLVLALAIYVHPLAALGLIVLQLLLVTASAASMFRAARRLLRRGGLVALTERTQPQLFALARDVAERLGVPLPPLYIVEDKSVNAFAMAVSPRRAVIVLHTGYLDVATPEQVRGVLAHELAHVANRDGVLGVALRSSGRLATLGQSLAAPRNPYRQTTNTDLALEPVRLLLGHVLPGLFSLIFAAHTRGRESLADLTAARALGGARPMLSTLRMLEEVHGDHTAKGSLRLTHPPSRARREALLDACGRQASLLRPHDPDAAS